MSKKEIVDKLVVIFRDKLYRDLTKCENVLVESIFGNNIALLPAEAYFLMLEIEKEFDIYFPYDVVENRQFNILGDIVKCIQSEIEVSSI